MFGFVAVDMLAPGASTMLSLKLPTPRQLSVADETGQQWLHPASYSIHIGTGPPREEGTMHKIALKGGAPTLL